MKPGFASPVDLSISPDFKNPIALFGGRRPRALGLPSREYYLDDSAKMKAHRAAYRNYIVTIEKLAGLPGGEAAADRIIALETALVKGAMAGRRPARHRQDLQPDDRRAAHQARAANSTGTRLSPRRVSELRQDVIVGRAFGGRGRRQDPRFDAAFDMEGVARVSVRFGPRVRFCQRRSMMRASLSISKELNGRSNSSATAGSAESPTSIGALGEGVGEIYVEDAFPGASPKPQMKELIGNLEDAYRERITQQPVDGRCDPQGCAREARGVRAADRPSGQIYRLFIDERRQGRSARQCASRGDVPVESASSSAFPNRSIARCGECIPQTINAYYNPLANQITFPAAILQPPFFDPNADAAVELWCDRRRYRPRDGPWLRR